jgi:hypothetical protein
MTRHAGRGLGAVAILALLLLPARGIAQGMDPRVFDIGNPVLRDVWVDPARGNDADTGAARATALRTLSEAWRRNAGGSKATPGGLRINLAAGDYAAAAIPEWMENVRGTRDRPTVLSAADGPGTARLHGYLNIKGCSYLYLLGLAVVTDPGYGGGGNVVHLQECDHVLLRDCRLDGYDGRKNQPQETLKANQCRELYVERCDIGGADWMVLDYVAVHGGHVVDSRIHDAGDDALVVKGGSAGLRIEANQVYRAGSIGLAVGQGTGFDFMVAPWLHYEAYDCKLVNNVVHDTRNAGVGVRGGYNILIAFNTFYKVGLSGDGAPLFLAAHGSRSCDGDEAACRTRREAGGWGPVRAGEAGEWVPNRNVWVCNNVFYNPAPSRTAYSHFSIAGPARPPDRAGIPSPSRADLNLKIAGNVIWNGPPDHPLGIEPGGGSGHDAGSADALRAGNRINAFEPRLVNPEGGDFRPAPGGELSRAASQAVPAFPGGDRPPRPLVPEGVLSNAVPRDAAGNARDVSGPPGAYCGGPAR